MTNQGLLYPLLTVYLGFLLFFSWRLSRGEHSNRQYLFGSGFGFFLSFLGISASLFSTFTLQGMPAFFRNHGIASWVFLGVTDVVLAGLLLFFGLKMRAFSRRLVEQRRNEQAAQAEQTVQPPKNLTEWLKQSGLSKLTLWFFIVSVTLFMIPYITIQIKGAAMLLQSALPLGETHLLWSLLMVGLMVGYSWFGGIRAIFITDAVQGVILLMTVWIIAGFAIHAAGGMSALFTEVATLKPALLSAPGPLGVLNWQFLLIGFISIVLMPYVQPQLATRVLVAKSDKTFALSAVALGVFAILVILPTLFIGLRSVALSGEGDFLLNLITHDAPPFFYALFVVGVLAAAMSTADSQLLAIGTEWSSALVSKDIQEHPSARILVKSVGVVVAVLALILAQSSFKSLVLFSINSFIGTSLLLPIIIASVVNCSRWRKALVAASMVAVTIFVPVMLGVLPNELLGLRVELWLYAILGVLIGLAYRRHCLNRNQNEQQPLLHPTN